MTATLSRRDFLKLSSLALGSLLMPSGIALAQAGGSFPLHKKIGEIHHVCPFCGVGCSMLVGVEGGKVVNIEGDPDSPINLGSLCSKGSALRDIAQSPQRVTKPLYRAAGSSKWEEKDWDWTLDEIAKRVKTTRDKDFLVKDKDGNLVNRSETVAWLGGAALDNEECAMAVHFARGLGLAYVEHQARI